MSAVRGNSPTIYDSAQRGPVALEEIRGVWQYRDLVYQLVRRDIVARYKRSVLGIAWTMLQPLGMMAVLSVVFSQLFHQVRAYPVYVLSGLIAWTFFAQTTNASMHQIVWGGALLKRIYVPRTVFAVSAAGTAVINLLISLIPVLLIAALYGLPLRPALLFVAVAVIPLTCFALGVGLLLSTWAVFFPDVIEMYQILLLAWMYLTPIIYPAEILPELLRGWILTFNPMVHLVNMFRMPLFDGVLPETSSIVIGTAVSLVTLVLGWLVYSSRADRFAYRL